MERGSTNSCLGELVMSREQSSHGVNGQPIRQGDCHAYESDHVWKRQPGLRGAIDVQAAVCQGIGDGLDRSGVRRLRPGPDGPRDGSMMGRFHGILRLER